MTPNEIINALLVAEPSTLKEVFAGLYSAFAKKAEDIYDANPQENGLLAQPYADLGDLMNEASNVFEEPEEPLVVDEAPLIEQAAPTTVSQAVEARAKMVKDPWGGR
jgi:hypothetical protein